MPMASLYILHNPLVLCKFFCKKSYGISKNIPHPPKYFLFSIEILQQTKGFLGGFYEIISLYNFTITFHPSRFIGISYNIGLYGKKNAVQPYGNHYRIMTCQTAPLRAGAPRGPPDTGIC